MLDMSKRILILDDHGISLDIGSQGRTSHHRIMLNEGDHQESRQKNAGSEAKPSTYQGCGNVSHFAQDCVKRATMGQSV